MDAISAIKELERIMEKSETFKLDIYDHAKIDGVVRWIDKSIVGDKQLNRDKLLAFCLSGLTTDGGHHKQWYLEQILKELSPTAKEIYNVSWDEGMP